MHTTGIYTTLLTALTPCHIEGPERIRIGSRYDGGYVLLDNNLSDIDVLYGYGVSTNIDFELSFCNRYNAIAKLYDPTVNGLPKKDSSLFFHREGVAGEKSASFNTLENHLIDNNDQDKKLLLKMDVEGAEWDSLINTPDSVLKKFQQITIEVHDLGADNAQSMAKKVQVLSRLAHLFHLFHVHANNFSNVHVIAGYKIPDVLELSYVNKELGLKASQNITHFPTPYDYPNTPKAEEIMLDFWPFKPDCIIPPTRKPFVRRKLIQLRQQVMPG